MGLLGQRGPEYRRDQGVIFVDQIKVCLSCRGPLSPNYTWVDPAFKKGEQIWFCPKCELPPLVESSK